MTPNVNQKKEASIAESFFEIKVGGLVSLNSQAIFL